MSSMLFNSLQPCLRRYFFCWILSFLCNGHENNGLTSCVRHSVDGWLLFVLGTYHARYLTSYVLGLTSERVFSFAVAFSSAGFHMIRGFGSQGY